MGRSDRIQVTKHMEYKVRKKTVPWKLTWKGRRTLRYEGRGEGESRRRQVDNEGIPERVWRKRVVQENSTWEFHNERKKRPVKSVDINIYTDKRNGQKYIRDSTYSRLGVGNSSGNVDQEL